MSDGTHLPSRRGICFILSSPSGTGKTTLARALLESSSQLAPSISVTTREPRPGEEEGIDYFFVSKEHFQNMAGRGDLLEWAEVFGNFYGTPAEPVKRALDGGKDIIFDVDWQGAAAIASLLPGDTVRVFILPPSAEELSRRIHSRGADAQPVIDGRLKAAADEISHWAEYDYALINRNISNSLTTLQAIILAERHKRHRQQGLGDFIAQFTADGPEA
jgi:guanylate kinase